MDVELEPEEAKTALIEGELFVSHVRAVRDLAIFVQLALQGLKLGTEATDFPGIFQRFARLSRLPEVAHLLDDAVIASQVERAKPLEEFALAQKERGYSYLHGLACVRLMTILETAVEEVVVSAFLKLPVPWSQPPLSRLQGPLLPFMRLSEEDRAAQLLELLSREINAPFQPGCAKFECLLEAVGLSGRVLPSVRRLILELSESRNVVVHKGGRVDSRFLQRCPWSTLKPGDDLAIDNRTYQRFSEASRWYLFEVYRRWTTIAYPLMPKDKEYTPPTTIEKFCNSTEGLIEQLLAPCPKELEDPNSAA